MIVCAQKRAKYALGEPKLDVKDMYVKEIRSQSLADVKARSLVSDSFPQKYIYSGVLRQPHNELHLKERNYSQCLLDTGSLAAGHIISNIVVQC